MSTSPHSRFQTPLHRRRTTISGQAPASRSICGSMRLPATSSTEHAYQPRATRRAPTLARHHAPPTGGNRRTASGARCVGDQAARSEARSAYHASLHQYHRTPQPARVTVSMHRSRPPTGHRRAAGGDATTTAPPLPDRRATRGVSSRCDPQRARGDLHKSRPGETRNDDCSPLHSPKRCVRDPTKPLAVVKWYKINAFWYKPDPPGLGGS